MIKQSWRPERPRPNSLGPKPWNPMHTVLICQPAGSLVWNASHHEHPSIFLRLGLLCGHGSCLLLQPTHQGG